MPSLNKVFLLGNLTRDVDVKYTPNGTSVATLGLAINSRYKDKASGTWKESAVFVDVTVWGKSAENCAQYLAKGRPVLVEGRLQLDQWESEGRKYQKLKVVADNVQFLSCGKEREQAPAEVPGVDEGNIPF